MKSKMFISSPIWTLPSLQAKLIPLVLLFTPWRTSAQTINVLLVVEESSMGKTVSQFEAGLRMAQESCFGRHRNFEIP